MNRLIIVGASGHGKVVADIAIRNGYKDIVFLDDDDIAECAGLPVVGKTNSMNSNRWIGDDFVVAIGDARARERIQSEIPGRVVTLIHPDACISARAKIGEGSVVMAGAVINSDSIIGRGCIVNTGATIDHDCSVGDFVHVSVGAHVAGTVRIGDRTWIGIGSIVSNNVDVCCDCVIGAGAVVVSDIASSGTYIGLPAKRLRGGSGI
ncbi:MAG: acetyltransferase [Coriobacteriaceae bacterium]|nr:acetyltransferase [Coriobacteriaceae bacterium]